MEENQDSRPAIEEIGEYGNLIDNLVTLGSRLITLHSTKLILRDLNPTEGKKPSPSCLPDHEIQVLAPLPPDRLLSAGRERSVALWDIETTPSIK